MPIALVPSVEQELGLATSLEEVEAVHLRFLGKAGIVTQKLRELRDFPSEDRKEKGALINQLREQVIALISEKRYQIQEALLEQQLEKEKLDLTLPEREARIGSLHLLSQVTQQIEIYFNARGFDRVEGPELETEVYNFDALNIPIHHPARQGHDTFYVQNIPSLLLRTHTSNAQIYALKTRNPPLRVFSMGRVYRSDPFDMTHSPMFHQLEGLVLGDNISIAHLKGCLSDFLCYFFKTNSIPLRFRPSFFPFTEPSTEIDVCCQRIKDELKIGKEGQWLELLGAGMVHPNVLKNCGIDPSSTQGFAFGIGLERLIMLKYGIADIRLFYEGSQTWLKHYSL